MPFDGLCTQRDCLFQELRLDIEAAHERIFFELKRKLLPQCGIIDKIGLIPVPSDVLTSHKEKVAREFFADPRRRKFNSLAKWREYSEPIFNNPDKDAILQWAESVLGPIPNEVHAIIARTEQRLETANIVSERVLGFFDIDPYIVLRWSEYDKVQKVCLAIWDRGEVISIAKLI